jgi:glycosyltransferase involved in cell wall biosynthesis
MSPRTSSAIEPSIAVIVPNWNDARHLPRCLHSVLDQESPPDELIVVDDASTDDSVATIKSLIDGNPHARLFENAVNQGTNRTINASLERVSSEYVLLLSANDFVLPGIFSRAKACLARFSHAGLWSAMSWLVDEEGRTIRLHPSPVVALEDAFLEPEQCVKLAYHVGNWFTGSTLIYHRNTLRSVGGFDPAYGAPSDFLAALTVASLRGAAYSPEPLAGFRIHEGSYSSRDLNEIAVLEAMVVHLRARGPQLSPKLFNDAFCDRISLRYRFAAVRASDGELISSVAAGEGGWRRAALRVVDRAIPRLLQNVRVGLAFLVLRPFDVWPTLVNRVLGWVIVRLRLLLRGQGSP